MTDDGGRMWLIDIGEPGARHIPVPDVATAWGGGLPAGTGLRLWDAPVLALAHQDLAPAAAREQVRAWAALGPMSAADGTGLHALPEAESVLAATHTPSDGTRPLEALRTAAAAHTAHGENWQRLCGRHLTEALEQVEEVTAASARAATAAFHGPPEGASGPRARSLLRPDLKCRSRHGP